VTAACVFLLLQKRATKKPAAGACNHRGLCQAAQQSMLHAQNGRQRIKKTRIFSAKECTSHADERRGGGTLPRKTVEVAHQYIRTGGWPEGRAPTVKGRSIGNDRS